LGIANGGQLLFKLNNVVARELDTIIDLIHAKFASNNTPTRGYKTIDCDVSNIIHKLSYRNGSIYSIALVRAVAIFLKQLAADTGYVVTPVLDGDVRPQSKRDAFRRRYESTMSKVNGFFVDSQP